MTLVGSFGLHESRCDLALKTWEFLAILPLDKLSDLVSSSHNVSHTFLRLLSPTHFCSFYFLFLFYLHRFKCPIFEFSHSLLDQVTVEALNYIFYFGHYSLQLYNFCDTFQ